MSNVRNSLLNRTFKDQRGQVLPWMALLMVLFLGMAGLTIDLSHAYVVYRALQASTDSATLAGAYAMTLSGATSTTVGNQVKAYSSLITGAGTTSGAGANADYNVPNVTLATPTLTCVTNSVYVQVPCTASATGDNVIQVTQTAQVPMYFIQALKVFGNRTPSTIPVSVTSTAAMQSGANQALNLAVVLDTTSSMNSQDNDTNCGNTRLYCSLQGMQTLLQSLSPCSTGSTSSNCLSGYDQVSLFTFPNIQANQASDDTSCPTTNPNIPSYSAPAIPGASNTTWTAPSGTSATYQVTNFEDNYSTNNQQNGGIATGSALGIASGANTGSKLRRPAGSGRRRDLHCRRNVRRDDCPASRTGSQSRIQERHHPAFRRRGEFDQIWLGVRYGLNVSVKERSMPADRGGRPICDPDLGDDGVHGCVRLFGQYIRLRDRFKPKHHALCGDAGSSQQRVRLLL